MDSISDVANIGGGGALVGWVFFFIIVGGAYLYNSTTSLERYRFKRSVLGYVLYLFLALGLVDIAIYLFR